MNLYTIRYHWPDSTIPLLYHCTAWGRSMAITEFLHAHPFAIIDNCTKE